jgi:hypothetical protein
MSESKLKIAMQIVKNLPRVPGALWSSWRGPIDTINLVDDDYKKLGISVQRRWVMRGSKKRPAAKPIIIKGLGLLPMRMTESKAMEWSGKFMERAAKLRGYVDEDSPVDQHTHMMSITSKKKLSVRNAIRLGFAINQIINNGPTYFNQESTGGMFNLTDCADYTVPDVRMPKEEVEATVQ